jgi:hypothetical protein
MNEKIKKLAEDTHFNIYNSPIWNGTGQRFVEAIIRECADIALREDHDPYECILNHFWIKK